jgi:hypothetical protein
MRGGDGNLFQSPLENHETSFIFIVMSNSISLKVQRGTTLVHKKYIRKTSNMEKRGTKIQKLAIEHSYPSRGIGTCFSTLKKKT